MLKNMKNCPANDLYVSLDLIFVPQIIKVHFHDNDIYFFLIKQITYVPQSYEQMTYVECAKLFRKLTFTQFLVEGPIFFFEKFEILVKFHLSGVNIREKY